MLNSGDGKGSHRGRTCAGIRTARLETSAAAAVGADIEESLSATLLSRQLVTFLPPPVGGLRRALPGNPVGWRERRSCLGGCPHKIGEALRVDLALPFPILCDTERRVVRDWGIYNSGERGGIAKPAVFIIDPSHVVRYASVDAVVRRVPAAAMVSLLQNAAEGQPVRRTVHVPLFYERKSSDSEYHSAVAERHSPRRVLQSRSAVCLRLAAQSKSRILNFIYGETKSAH